MTARGTRCNQLAAVRIAKSEFHEPAFLAAGRIGMRAQAHGTGHTGGASRCGGVRLSATGTRTRALSRGDQCGGGRVNPNSARSRSGSSWLSRHRTVIGFSPSQLSKLTGPQ